MRLVVSCMEILVFPVILTFQGYNNNNNTTTTTTATTATTATTTTTAAAAAAATTTTTTTHTTTTTTTVNNNKTLFSEQTLQTGTHYQLQSKDLHTHTHTHVTDCLGEICIAKSSVKHAHVHGQEGH